MKKFSKKFSQLIDFINFTHEFREVVRIARSPNASKYENDAEHSYQLAVVAWYIIETEKLKLNKELCFMYALAHDLVEIYAGDTFFYDKVASNSKHKREREALKKIKKRFSHFRNLVKIIEKYEKREGKESRFIYALDKILPPIQIYLENGKLWHEKGVSFKRLVENKSPKIIMSKHIDKYWQELLKEIERNKKKLFLK